MNSYDVMMNFIQTEQTHLKDNKDAKKIIEIPEVMKDLYAQWR